MGKLGKEKREKIVEEILDRKFGDRIKKLDHDCLIAVTKVIEDEQKGIPFKACSGYIHYSEHVYIYRNHTTRKVRGQGEFYVKLSPPRPSKQGSFYFHPESDKWTEKFISEKERINDEKESMRETLMAVMNSCNTEKQLFETLPDIEPIYKDLFNNREEVSVVAVETLEKARGFLQGISE